MTVDPDGTLRLALMAGFQTDRPIRLTLTLPADAPLASLHNFGAGSLVLAPGFNNITALEAASHSLGDIVVQHVEVDTLSAAALGYVALRAPRL